jgi:hypothetical protein
VKTPDRCLPVLSAGIRSGVAPVWPQVTSLVVVRRLPVLGPALRLRRLGRHDSLLARPDRAGSPPATVENGAGQEGHGVVRGCLLGTGQDCCEWHASGTAGEDDDRSHVAATAPNSAGGEAVLGDHRLVGKSPKGSRQPGLGDLNSAPPPGTSTPKVAWLQLGEWSDLWFPVTCRDRWYPLDSLTCPASVVCTHSVSGSRPLRSRTPSAVRPFAISDRIGPAGRGKPIYGSCACCGCCRGSGRTHRPKHLRLGRRVVSTTG